MQSLWFHVTGFQTYLDLIFKLSMYCRSPKIQKDADDFPSSGQSALIAPMLTPKRSQVPDLVHGPRELLD